MRQVREFSGFFFTVNSYIESLRILFAGKLMCVELLGQPGKRQSNAKEFILVSALQEVLACSLMF